MDDMFTTTGGGNDCPNRGTHMYLWLVVVGGFVAFAMAWGIGANDVANAFATSVGAKAITLKQAVIIAAIFEFSGAFFLGSTVAETVRKGIADYDTFEKTPDLLLLGFFSSLCSASLILALVTRYSLPISTTQAIVGAIMGFAIVANGWNAVHWDQVWLIVVFWIASPMMTGILSSSFYLFVRTVWLRRDNAFELVMKTWGVFIFFAAFIMTLFMILKGIKRFDIEVELGDAVWISIVVAIGVAGILWAALHFSGLLQKHIDSMPEGWHSGGLSRPHEGTLATSSPDSEGPKVVAHKPVPSAAMDTPTGAKAETETEIEMEMEPVVKSNLDYKQKMRNAVFSGVEQDVTEDLDEVAANILRKAEVFDPKVERAFTWLQVSTAALDILAHGSNDVANSISPFAAMVALWEEPDVEEDVDVPLWILALGGAGMVIGLATYGYKVIKTIGVRMINMSSSRGYCIELSTALMVIIGSYYGFPTSTTHTQVGATIGVGLVEYMRKDTKLTIQEIVHWKLVALILTSWVFALVGAAFISGLIFAIFAYTPSV